MKKADERKAPKPAKGAKSRTPWTHPTVKSYAVKDVTASGANSGLDGGNLS